MLKKGNTFSTSIEEIVYLIIVLSLGLFLRTYSVLINGIGQTIDTYNYIKQAELLINGGYSLYFPNGFPLIIVLLIPFRSLFDLSTALIILNIILSTATVYFIYEICKEAFANKTVSLIAIFIAAFYPNQIKYVRWVLSEVPCAFFLTLSLYLFVKKKYKFSGAAIGLASMIRTTLLPVGLLFAVYLFVKRNAQVYKYFSFYVLIPLIFLTYGFLRTGYFTIGQNAAHNLSISTEYSDTTKFPKVNLKNLNGSFKDYVSYAIGNPSEFLHDRMENLWDLWGPAPPLNNGFRMNSRFFWAIGIRSVLLLLAIFGFMKSYKNQVSVFSILIIASVTAVHFFYFADPRFTYTVEPFAIILTSAGITSFLTDKRKSSP